MNFPGKDLLGRAIDMAFGALVASLVCGVVSTGAAFSIAAALGMANLAFDLSCADDEDDY